MYRKSVKSTTGGDVSVSAAPTSAPNCKDLADIRAVLSQYQGFINTSLDYESDKFMNILTGLDNLFFDHEPHRIKMAAILVQYKFTEYLKNVLEYGSKVGSFKSKVFDVACQILVNLHNYTDASTELSKRLLDLGIIKYFTTELKKPVLLEQQIQQKVELFVKSLLGTLHNCVRHFPGDLTNEQQQHLNTVLSPYLSSKVDSIRMLTVMILSLIINEDQYGPITDTDCIEVMVNHVTEGLNQSNRSHDGFSVIELLQCLTRLAVNDDNKNKLINAGLLPGIVKIMKTGGEDEQEMAARLTWTLCFDDNAKQKVIKEPGYVDELHHLSASESRAVQFSADAAQYRLMDNKFKLK